MIGAEAAHAAANAVFGAPLEDEAELFSSGGFGLELVPLLSAVALGAVLLGLAAQVAGRQAARRWTALPFACLPPVMFALQEHLEALLHTGAFPAGTMLEPTFFPGLAMQLPFALAGYLAARARCSSSARKFAACSAAVRKDLSPSCNPHRSHGRSTYRAGLCRWAGRAGSVPLPRR